MPLSAITGKAAVMDHPQVGGLGGTYAGNSLACRAGLAVLEQFKKKRLLARAKEIGKKVFKRFKEDEEKYLVVGDVRGVGPWWEWNWL